MGRHEGAAMGRQTDLVLNASLPKHKNPFQVLYALCLISHRKFKKKLSTPLNIPLIFWGRCKNSKAPIDRRWDITHTKF